MQTEIDALTEEIYRIKNATEFNGKKILGEEEVQRMTEAEAIAQGYTVVKTAEELQEAFYKKNENGNGNFDLVNGRYVRVTEGTGKYDQRVNDKNCKIALFADIDLNELGFDETGSNWTVIGGTDFKYGFTGILNGNGYSINNLVLKYNNEIGQGLFRSIMSGGNVKNLTLDNFNVIPQEGNGGNYIGLLAGTIRGNSAVENVHIKNSHVSGRDAVAGFAGDMENSTISNCSITNTLIEGNGVRTGGITGQIYTNFNKFNKIYSDCESKNNKAGAIIGNLARNPEIINDIYYKNNGISSIGSALTGIDIEAERAKIKESTTNPFVTEIEVKTNLQVGISSDETSVITVDTGFSLDNFKISVLNEFSARSSLDKVDAMIAKVSGKLIEIGAVQNRLESTMESQEVQKTTLTSANSLIKDADIAEESANYVKNQILQQTTASLLATANQSPSIALQLV